VAILEPEATIVIGYSSNYVHTLINESELSTPYTRGVQGPINKIIYQKVLYTNTMLQQIWWGWGGERPGTLCLLSGRRLK